MQQPKYNRSCHLAGNWFPADSSELKAKLETWRSPESWQGIGAIIVPHAGYIYSGALAAQTYSRLPANYYDQVLILAPSHYLAMPNKVSVELPGLIKTPFGEVEFSSDLYTALTALPGAIQAEQAHIKEHSVQIQLPLIQHFLGNCQVGALLVGQWTDFAALGQLAIKLRKLLTAKTLVVISTDFTHYGPRFGYTPFSDLQGVALAEAIKNLDYSVIEPIKNLDFPNFLKTMQTTQATVCGQAALSLLLAMLPESAQVLEVGYENSATLTNDWENTVSYWGAGIKVNWDEVKQESLTNFKLSESAKQQILELAKKSLHQAVMNNTSPSLPETLLPELQQLRGAFVTLHQHGALRGCIGEILPQRPLAQVIVERAKDAALHDTRFRPVSAQDLLELEVEVSVLGVPVAARYEEIILGQHGIILQKAGRSAVFLPQVAPEQGWDLPTTLSHLAQKAGLPATAWQEGASFFVFTAEVFN